MAYVTVRHVGTSSFLINHIVLVACTRLSILLVSLPSSLPTAFHQVPLSLPNNEVSIVSFRPCLLQMWETCGKLKRLLATRCWATWVRIFFLKLRGGRRKQCWTLWGDACVLLSLGILGDFKYVLIFLIYGFGSVTNLGDV